MKRHWFIGILISMLTVIGICQNKFSSPNQEITVNFGNVDVSEDQSQLAIETLRAQLATFGINDIHISEVEDGVVKITYYSSVEVENIKQGLSVNAHFDFDYTSAYSAKNKKSSSGQSSKTYDLDIYELHKSTDNSGSAGKAVYLVKQDFDRFLNPNVIIPFDTIDAFTECRLFKEAFKVYHSIAILIETPTHATPEVRAGPNC